MKFAKALVLILTLALVAPLAQAQTAEEVVARGLEAIGGADAYMKLDTLVLKGTLSMAMMGGEMPFTTYQKRQAKMRYDVEMQGMVLVQATDGVVAWGINPFMGSNDPIELPPDQTKMFIRQSDFDGQYMNFEERGIALEYLGRETIDDKDYDLVRMVWTDDGMTFDNYFDPETALLTYMKFEESGMEIVTRVSDYRDIGNGIKIAFLIEQFGGMNGDMTITVEEAEVNVPLDDSLFAMPQPEPAEETK